MRHVTCVLALFLACGCADEIPSSGQFPSASQIKELLKQDLRGIPLIEFEQRLGIEKQGYDEVYTNQPEHSRRLYHLDGFCIDLSVEHRGNQLFTDAHFYPGVGEDGLTKQLRMNEYEAALSEHFAERQKGLDAIRESHSVPNGPYQENEF